MVHRSGSTHQCVEIVENDEPNENSNKNDLVITDSFKANVTSNSTAENDSKRQLRTSKRLNSVNSTDVMTPPKTTEVSSTSKSTTATTITIKPRPIRNRRYTVNDCVRPIERNTTVPFVDRSKNSKLSPTDDILSKAKTSITSYDDLYNFETDKLNCSVSLERLSGIGDTSTSDRDDITNSPDNSEKDDSVTTNKILCLYCDRSFASSVLYTKHVERMHQSKSGRRFSARTSTNSATTSNYIGCFYCNVGKVTCLESEELSQLVHHLVQQHSDKYFTCEECLIRFQTRELLLNHSDIVHGCSNTKNQTDITAIRKNDKNVQSTLNVSEPVTPLTVQVEFETNELRNRLRRSNDLKNASHSERSSRKQFLSSEEMFLSRLGIGLNRSPRSRKGAKNRRGCSSELFQLENSRSTRGNKNSKQSSISNESIESSKSLSGKIESISAAFDEDFYEQVNQNVKQNLSCHLDGKLQSGPISPSPLSPVANIPAVRSILVKSPLATEAEIHEATTISAFTAFPTLLTAKQYGGESLTAGKIKKPITKHSWKWKWDCVKKYKYVNEGGKIVKKIKQSTSGMRDLSTIDMWTQLTMRTRHESVMRQETFTSGKNNILGVGEVAREEKRKLIEQLNKILDTRVLPKIKAEQNDQTIIKLEVNDSLSNSDAIDTMSTPNTLTSIIQNDQDFPASINLIKRNQNLGSTETSLILSGEWARPRSYICVGCGSIFSTIRSLEEHKSSKHPFVHSTHYEIVGKDLIDGDLFKNFYIPSMALKRYNELNKKQFLNSICSAEDSMDSVTSYSMSLTKSDSFDLDSNSRNSKTSISSGASISDRSYSMSTDEENANSSTERSTSEPSSVCSKCERKCKGLSDLYRHMLDCSSDYAWILAKKRNNIKYRYFGVRRRRQQRSASSTVRKVRPKKERHNSDTSGSQKDKEPTTPRQRPSDAESIQRMLANLPAKRAVRQIIPNLTQKPNNKNKKNKILMPNSLSRKKILLKQKTKVNTRGYKVVSTPGTTITSVGANLALRKRRNADSVNAIDRRTRASLGTKKNDSKSDKILGNKPSGSSLAGLSPTETKIKKKMSDVGNVFRRRTKAVVSKISNSLIRVQNQRKLRTAKSSPNTSINTKNVKLNQSTPISKRKKTFLRTLSSRRSNRNQNKRTDYEPKKPSNESKANLNEERLITDKNSSQPLKNEEKKCNIEEPIHSSSIPNQVEEEAVMQSISPDIKNVPRLKRKRSIKTIINEMRAKCQDKVETELLESVEVPTKVPETQSPVEALIPSNKNFLVDSNHTSSPIIQVPFPVSVTMPLSLTIESIDEPLNLCISPQKNSNCLPSSFSNASENKSSLSTLHAADVDTISPRRRTRKLNDCIAMLTGKLQEKLGVPFIDQTSSLLPILSPGSEAAKVEPKISPTLATKTTVCEEKEKDAPVQDQERIKEIPVAEKDAKPIAVQNYSSISSDSSEIEASKPIKKHPSVNGEIAELEKIDSSIAKEISNILDQKTTQDVQFESNTKPCQIKSNVVEIEKEAFIENIKPKSEKNVNIANTESIKQCLASATNVVEQDSHAEIKENTNKGITDAKGGIYLFATKDNADEKTSKSTSEAPKKKNKNDVANDRLPMKIDNLVIESGQEPTTVLVEKSFEKVVEKSSEKIVPSDKSKDEYSKSNENVNDSAERLSTERSTRRRNTPLKVAQKSTKRNSKVKEDKTQKSPKKAVETLRDKENSLKKSEKATISVEDEIVKSNDTEIEKPSNPVLSKVIDVLVPTTSSKKGEKLIIAEKQEKQKKSEQESKTENSKINEKTSKSATKSDGSGNKSKKLEKIDTSISIFDNSDEELLPWDAEKGFTQTKSTDPVMQVSYTTSIKDPRIKISCKSNDVGVSTVVPKTKKKRKSELAQIIADQLLESFKEVDKSRIDELKKIHDLSLSSSEDLISKSLSTTPIPKRRAKKLFEDIEPVNRKKAAGKTKVGAQKDNPPENKIDSAKNEYSVKVKEATIKAEKRSPDSKQQKEKAPKILQKKKTNKDINVTKQKRLRKELTTEPNVKDEPSQNIFEMALKNDINKKSPIVSSTSNIQGSTSVEKLIKKSLFGAPNSATIFSMSEKSKNDILSSASNLSKKSNSIFEEVLQSHKNSKTERLSDIIGLSDKEALSRVPSIKNVVFSQWPIEKTNSASGPEKILKLNDNKTRFWNRSNASQTGDAKVGAGKSKIFDAMKSKARDLFSKISKKKSKKSRVGMKTKIRSSSSSSSSSSTSSSSSSDVPKKPLLRPSILSCNSFRDLVHVENSLSSTTTTKTTNDIFDCLRKSSTEVPKPVSLSPQKLNIRQKTKNEKNMIVENPKFPIESDMNIAKIAIALEKSNRTELHNQVKQNLKETSSVDKVNFSSTRYRPKRNVSTKSDDKLISPQINTELEFPQTTENDDSQDTIISQIVNKIREKAEKTDSDDEMCLTEASKGLSTKLKQPNSESPVPDILKLDASNDVSALIPASNKINENHLFIKKDNEKCTMSVSIQNDDQSDDENTNTELIDMDLEDNESIYTTFSQSTVTTSGRPNRKKRKKKSILSSGRKSKKNQSRQLSSPSATFFCDICQKSFRNQHGLNNHKNTITHISKLSEQEFLNAKEKENELKKVKIESSETTSATLVINKDEKLDATMKRQAIPIKSDEPSLKIVVDSPSDTHLSPKTSSISFSQISPSVNHIETVPPFGSISKILGSSKPVIAQSTLNSRLMLSQEERLFYECCSMLKGSDRTTVGISLTEPIIKPVIPKSTEQTATISHAAQSPRSHSSPRPGIHKTNINSFTDISCDSNPAYSCPQVPSSSKTHKVFSLGSPTSSMSPKATDNIHIGNVCVSPRKSNKEIQSNEKILINGQDCHSNLRNYPDSFSDMGDSFPSSKDASESENYAQTISERSNHFGDDAAKTSMNLPIISQKAEDGSYGSSQQQPSLPNENVDIGSVSNRCNLEPSRPRTKAALKNYENLKVSIPTSGLDLQHALDRSPNSNGCKLAALADIALGNDVPLNLIDSKSSSTVENESRINKPSPSITSKSVMKHTPSFILSSESIKTHSIEIKTKTFESAFNVTPKNKKRTPQSIGEKTGFKERKRGVRSSSKFPSNPELMKTVSFKPKDVYDFEESHDSVEDEIVPLTHSRSNKTEPTSAVESNKVKEMAKKSNDEADDESSYSDRDDYYNFNSVSGSGTEDLENPVDDDEHSRHAASSQTSKNSSRSASNLQKKCVIMGRIFKNATKNPEPSIVEKKEKATAEPIPEQELDAIFDNLKNKKSGKDDRPSSTRAKSSASKMKTAESDDEKFANDNKLQTSSKPRKSREVANLEAEWGMSVGQIKELIGVGKRKSQRKCASNRQNKFVETWSSDEYEEFHSTKDIIALIQEAEMKALRTKSRLAKQNAETNATIPQNDNENEYKSGNPSTDASIELKEVKKEKPKVKSRADSSSNGLVIPSENDNIPTKTVECIKPKTKKTSFEKFQSEGESDFDEHWNKTAKRAKIRDRRRTIATREEASNVKDIKIKKHTPEPSISKKQKMNMPKKCKNVPPATESNDKIKHTMETSKMNVPKNSKSGVKSKNSKSTTRRKRIASDMLYYWSSSSDEEFGRIQPSDHDDEDNSENHLEQHGWIVGDSHKKLVTLLAHAKGKKIEDCGVKETIHKKK